MNAYNFFKFLKDKRGKEFPRRYTLFLQLQKILYAPETLTPEDLIIKGDFYLGSKEKVSSLPNNLVVDGDFNIVNDSIKSLPDNLRVKGWLDISSTQIDSIPNNLRVHKSFYGNMTLSQKYTNAQIRQMVKEKGGSIRGSIF